MSKKRQIIMANFSTLRHKEYFRLILFLIPHVYSDFKKNQTKTSDLHVYKDIPKWGGGANKYHVLIFYQKKLNIDGSTLSIVNSYTFVANQQNSYVSSVFHLFTSFRKVLILHIYSNLPNDSKKKGAIAHVQPSCKPWYTHICHIFLKHISRQYVKPSIRRNKINNE